MQTIPDSNLVQDPLAEVTINRITNEEIDEIVSFLNVRYAKWQEETKDDDYSENEVE